MSATHAGHAVSDNAFQNAIRDFFGRRASELCGIAAILLATAAFPALLSYDAADPSLLHATDRSPTNLLGYAGSAVADPLLRSAGAAAFLLPAALLIWGLRRIFHIGRARIAFLAVFLLPAILLLTPGLAMLTPPDAWQLHTGLGGFLGDRFLVTVSGWALLFQDYLPPPVARGVLGALLAFCSYACFSLCYGAGARAVLAIFWGPPVLLVQLVEEIGRLLSGALVALYRRLRQAAANRTASRPETPAKTVRPRRRFRLPSLGIRKTREEWDRSYPSFLHAFRKMAGPLAGDATPEAVHGGARTEPTIGGQAAPAWPVSPVREPVTEPVEIVEEPAAPPARKRRKRKTALPAVLPAGDAGYVPPSVEFLASTGRVGGRQSELDVEGTAEALEAVLHDYRIGGDVLNARPGPAVTLFELDPPPGLKASRLESLADDIARSMGVISARIATVTGSKTIGIEIPNPSREAVLLREVLDSAQYRKGRAFLPLALGKNILGEPVVADLEKMPHLLVAGTTGSGKSVAINAMILSLLYRLPPSNCRMILIDPKMLEFSIYDDIPHLLTPVVTDPQTAVQALKWVVREMEERYRMMSQVGVRNIANFNARLAKSIREGKPVTREIQRGFDPETGEPIRERVELGIDHLPRIVVVVDEMADLMMVAGKEIEACVQRLAQMARASGIHLIMATQRPSVDVITGTIKANFPTRISFRLSSKIDSRTILNEQGAEKLLGQGDMLYQEAGARVTRIHGPFVSEDEIEKIVGYLHTLGPPDYVPDVTVADDDSMPAIPGLGGESRGESNSLVDQAIEIITRDQKASTSYLQRKLGIGYNRAASVMEELEAMGAVSPPDHVGKRQILVGGAG